MPPTYSPFWKPFEEIARFAAARHKVGAGDLALGPSDGLDATGGSEWKAFADPAKLYAAWGPSDASPWSAYHRPTLFAAIDSIHPERVGPRTSPGFDAPSTPRELPAWCEDGTIVILDLPGPVSVAYAALLAARDRRQPVATFNNWPNSGGIVDAGSTLAALLSFAQWVSDAKAQQDEKPAPVLMLDSWRLGARPPAPGDFDNRYYLLDSDLPSAQTLANQGIARVVYVHAPLAFVPPEPNFPVETDDLNGYLFALSKRMEVSAAVADVAKWGLGPAAKYEPRVRKTAFSTQKDPAFRGFRRNAAGGFGVLVPDSTRGAGAGFAAGGFG